jgi:hypothetical protein
MFQPEATNETERANDRQPACRVVDILNLCGHIKARCEKRKAETEDQIAEASKRDVNFSR